MLTWPHSGFHVPYSRLDSRGRSHLRHPSRAPLRAESRVRLQVDGSPEPIKELRRLVKNRAAARKAPDC
jgi:hypothetical protein